MTILTPQLAAQKLDAFGEPRHLESRREITIDEARRFLRVTDQRTRIKRIARELHVSPGKVYAIWGGMLSR